MVNTPSGSALRVLVVDDHEHVRRIICDLLKSETHIDIVCEASNGSEAVHFARQHRPDLVLLDIKMPVMNGFEAARHIMRERPETRILMVSQFDSPAFVIEAFAAGAIGYIVKDRAATDLIPELRRIQSHDSRAGTQRDPSDVNPSDSV